MQLVHEDKANIPAESVESFVEFEQDGKTVFMHKDLAESKKTAYRTQGQLTKLTGQFDDVKGTLSEFQGKQELAIQAAKEEAEKLAFEKFRKDNDVEGALALQNEKFSTTISELKNSLQAEKDGRVALQGSILSKEMDSLAIKVANKYASPDFVEAASELIKSKRMKSADGELAFTNASGEAVELDIDGIVDSLSKDPLFKPFAKAPNNKPGFTTNGGNNGSQQNSNLSKNADAEAAKKSGDSIGLLRANIRENLKL